MSALDPKEELVATLPFLRAAAFSLAGDEAKADDLVNSTAEKAWKNIGKFKPRTDMRAWLFTIMRNTFYSVLRSEGREVADTQGSAEAALRQMPVHDGRLAIIDLRRALDTLPPEQREAVLLVGAAGFTYEEAAAICGVAVGTVKSRTNRGRQRLAILLGYTVDSCFFSQDKITIAAMGTQQTVW